ncbi:hypothetical protein GLOIN_2v1711901 [Rhizophagus irregularis DAOM 181602=DAOM 197198]|nr:hypothetical protein GLOIN_2v1711901 [Rhizophagus irregularis DAOM 181602=DAOM 197198]
MFISRDSIISGYIYKVKVTIPQISYILEKNIKSWEDFTQRLKNENRYQDEKEIGEKRPILESPSKLDWSPDQSIEEIEDDEERNRIWTERYLERRERENFILFTNGGRRNESRITIQGKEWEEQ